MGAPLDRLAPQYTANEMLEMPDKGALHELLPGFSRSLRELFPEEDA